MRNEIMEQEKLVQVLSDAGIPKKLAKTLIYIYQVDESRSADIERGTDLRQSEVSKLTGELCRREWIKKRDIKKKGRGRPVHIYRCSTLSKILKNLEQEKVEEIEGIKKDLSELKNLIN